MEKFSKKTILFYKAKVLLNFLKGSSKVTLLAIVGMDLVNVLHTLWLVT